MADQAKALARDVAEWLWDEDPGESKPRYVQKVSTKIADVIRAALAEVKQQRDNAYAILEGEKKCSVTLHEIIEQTKDQLAVAQSTLEWYAAALEPLSRAGQALAEIKKIAAGHGET